MWIKCLKFVSQMLKNSVGTGENGRLSTLVKHRIMCYPFPKQALVFTCLQYKSFENTAGKGEIA